MSNVLEAVNPQHITRCEKIIRPHIRRTPVIEIDGTDVGLETGLLRLKLELFQHSGSFKAPGALPVHAFDQDETMLGQGTVALEFDEQARDIDTLLVSVGGGGFIAGIAAWYAGRIKIIGVEPSAAPTLTKALQAGRPVDAEA